MASFSFDGDNLLITAQDTTDVDVQVDLYSDWKEWVKLTDNAKYPPAFDTDGGRPTSPTETSGRNFFLRNDLGWRIRPTEADYNPSFIGNLFAADVSLPIVVPTLGAFTVLWKLERSNLSTLIGGSATSSEVATAQSAIQTDIANIPAAIGISALELIDNVTYNSRLLVYARKRIYGNIADRLAAVPNDPLDGNEIAVFTYRAKPSDSDPQVAEHFGWLTGVQVAL